MVDLFWNSKWIKEAVLCSKVYQSIGYRSMSKEKKLCTKRENMLDFGTNVLLVDNCHATTSIIIIWLFLYQCMYVLL